MRKVLLVFAMLALCALPVQAIEHPWTQGDIELLLEGSYFKQADTREWVGDVSVGWMRFMTEKQQLGSVVSLTKTDEGDTGYSVGPIYEWNFANLQKGHFFLGGDAQFLLNDLADLADYGLTGRVGYKLHVGKSSAIRFGFDYDRAVSEKSDDLGDRINGFGFSIGISIGIQERTEIS